ncbi:hypothetical protein RND71_004986 [Anisodus tanguticus]|uniref:Uncharacterized protein n=1 Tax=Anisodus tanguticus TaxID=243964 RepID=A0AAE1SP67_9SOLA|nr:hypothetical protein RND71_004986 [Anisodus tanguticus]
MISLINSLVIHNISKVAPPAQTEIPLPTLDLCFSLQPVEVSGAEKECVKG